MVYITPPYPDLDDSRSPNEAARNLIGGLPALVHLVGLKVDVILPWERLVLWSVSLCFFGLVFVA